MAGLNFLNSDPMFCPKSTQQIEPGFKIVMRKLLLYGYVTHYKSTKKVRISQHGLPLKHNDEETKFLPRVTYNAKLNKLYETPIPM